MNKKIIMVDDEIDILNGYQRNLRKYFNIKTFTDPFEALDFISESEDYAVIVSDYKMPRMNGSELLEKTKKNRPDMIRIMVTGYADIDIAMNAVNRGNVFRFLTKPISAENLIESIYSGIEFYDSIMVERELLDKTLKGSVKLLIELMTLSSPLIFSKAVRLRKSAKKICDVIKIDKLWEMEIAALLSQIGCLTLPQEIVEKKFNGMELTVEEEIIFHSHPEIGKNLIKNIPKLESIAEYIFYQNHDFSYFDKISGIKINSELPLISRILKVVSDFDYLKQMGIDDDSAIRRLISKSYKYDNDILNTFDKLLTGNFSLNTIKSLPLRQLRVGMTLAEDIKDSKGIVLIRSGYELTDVILMHLVNAAKVRVINEPVRVFD